jgi:hypothetical protein
MAGLLLLTLITTFHPARPTIGDPVTINFAVPTTVDASADYEVVSHSGNSVVIRTFVPHTITVGGRSADGAVSIVIPIHSVLKPDDKLEPAPLKPPRPESWPRLPFVAIGIAVLAAAGAWTGVVLLARKEVSRPRVVVVPAEELRSRVLALQRDARAAMRWARLADAVRGYLAAVRGEFGSELTTAELLVRIGNETKDHRRYVAPILRQGDLEKFSPWGAPPESFDDAAARALEIPTWAEPVVIVEPAADATKGAAG